jgi:hypothetical protein
VAEPLESHGVTRHMVGHLQRNKVRLAVTVFDWVQSVDSGARPRLSERWRTAASRPGSGRGQRWRRAAEDGFGGRAVDRRPRSQSSRPSGAS